MNLLMVVIAVLRLCLSLQQVEEESSIEAMQGTWLADVVMMSLEPAHCCYPISWKRARTSPSILASILSSIRS